MKISLLSCLMLVLLLCSCTYFLKPIKDTLPGTWRMYDISPAEGDGTVPFEQAAEQKKLISKGFVYSFFEDGTYTEARDTSYFGHGTYKFSAENTMHLIDDSGKVNGDIILKKEGEQNGKQQLSFTSKNKHFMAGFIKESDPLKTFTDDPLYPANNKWRIKPTHAEDTAELKARLGNYFKHIALILKAATERKQHVVSFEFSLGLLKIYDGGIGIYPYSTVPDNWKNCFYNDVDAKKAYDLYDDYLESNSYYGGATTGNWFVDDYNILLSVYADFNKEKK